MSNHNENTLPIVWERFSIYIAGVLLAICAYMFIEQKSRIDVIEQRVVLLQVDKVSRQELNDLENRISQRMDTMKTDIIDRLDFYLSSDKKKQ